MMVQPRLLSETVALCNHRAQSKWVLHALLPCSRRTFWDIRSVESLPAGWFLPLAVRTGYYLRFVSVIMKLGQLGKSSNDAQYGTGMSNRHVHAGCTKQRFVRQNYTTVTPSTVPHSVVNPKYS